jgi:Domain of unknown function (DUF6285)
MRERPDAAVLLALAEELEAAAPHLPPERRVDPALLARARAIWARERDAGDAPKAACHGALVGLYGAGEFGALFARLTREIRAGTYDAPGAEREAVLEILWAVTQQKLRESNPDYLATAAFASAFSGGVEG